jgi:hypothetical protein
VWYRPYDRTANVEEANERLSHLEVNLVKQIERDDDARFRSFRALTSDNKSAHGSGSIYLGVGLL